MKSQFGVLFTKTYDILPDYYGISDLGLPLPHFEFWSLCLNILIKIFIFCAKSYNFDQTYLNTGLKTQNAEEFSLDQIFHNHFW